MGLWILVLGVVLDQNYGSWAALAIAFAGAYAGKLAKRVIAA